MLKSPYMVPPSAFTDVPTAIEEIRAGRMVVVVDDEDRENEGDLTLAAEKVTPEADQLHGQVRPRLDLPGHDRGATGSPAHRAYVGREHVQLRHRIL